MKPQRSATFTTHEQAARADWEANWAKTPQQRLVELEFLRRQRYPNGVAPRLKRVIEFIERGESPLPTHSPADTTPSLTCKV